MQALSLKQPWAELLFPEQPSAGGLFPQPGRPIKTIETRWWGRALQTQARRLAGHRIAIHASKSLDCDGLNNLHRTYAIDIDTRSLARGAIIGTVLLIGCCNLTPEHETSALCECAGKFGLLLAHPRRLAEPIPTRGMLGFFTIPNIPEELS